MQMYMFIAELIAAIAGNADVRTMVLEQQAPMNIEQTTSAFEATTGVTPEMLFKMFALLQLRDKHCLGQDVRNVVLKDLCFVYLLPTMLSAYLKENKQNPEAVLNLIGQLFKDHGHGISVSELKMALADAQMSIVDIQDERAQNCLCRIIPCSKKNRNVHDLDCIAIIFNVAPLSIWDLISKLDSGGWSAWHEAIHRDHDDIVDLFIKWANANNMVRALLSIKTKWQDTALHIIVKCWYTGILKILLAQADKCGMVEELLYARDIHGNTVLDHANQCQYTQAREEMISIIEEYLAKSKLARMSLESNDQ
jgi:hypothetical protein